MNRYKPRTIPSNFNSYWAVFLTLRCNLNCDYCIQKIEPEAAKRALGYKEVSGNKWVLALTSIQNRTKKRFLRPAKKKKIAIIGGEPTIHPGFFELINGLDKNWSITVTTNLDSPVFSDVKKFLKNIKPKGRLKFHASLHPKHTDVRLFIERVTALRRGGLNIRRLFMVAHPEMVDKIPQYERIFEDKGLSLEVQRFMGFYNDKLYPLNNDSSSVHYHFDDGIADYEKYRKAFSLTSKKKIWCRLNRVLFAPDGDIYNCHYKVYTKSDERYGNIFDQDFKSNIPTDYFLCDDYGYCNPCEYPYAEFKPV